MTDRGSAPGAHRPRKGQSTFPLPSVSEHGKGSFGTSTDISMSNWTKSQQRQHWQDVELSGGDRQDSKTGSWLPSRTFSQSNSRSSQTSFWSPVDQAGSPPSAPMPSRTRAAEGTGKASVDERIDLLQAPEASYYTVGRHGNDRDVITALPEVGILPDEEYTRYGTPRKWDRGH